MFAAASSLQEQTVKCWNPKSKEPTLTVYLGLLSIDEAVLEECGAITLDLLLRARVLIEGNGGGWSLAPKYHLRCIYLFGDVKTLIRWQSLCVTCNQGKLLTPLPIFKEGCFWKPCLVFGISLVIGIPNLACSLQYSICTMLDSWSGYILVAEGSIN